MVIWGKKCLKGPKRPSYRRREVENGINNVRCKRIIHFFMAVKNNRIESENLEEIRSLSLGDWPKMGGQPHPYVPRDLILPDYVPVVLSQSTIVGIYGLISTLVALLVWFFSGGRSRKISKVDRLLMCWWAFTGLTHLILEGYFVFSPEFYKEKTGFYLAEVWKEYSKGDSRYVGRDVGVVSVEGITAVLEGPASLLAVYAIATGKSYSYILQFAISFGQLYGTAVYFITSILEGDNFASSSFYYYSYYVGANASWVVIPSLISIRCWNKICAAVQLQTHKKSKTR